MRVIRAVTASSRNTTRKNTFAVMSQGTGSRLILPGMKEQHRIHLMSIRTILHTMKTITEMEMGPIPIMKLEVTNPALSNS